MTRRVVLFGGGALGGVLVFCLAVAIKALFEEWDREWARW